MNLSDGLGGASVGDGAVTDTEPPVEPGARPRRGRAVTAASLVVFVLAYVLVLWLYGNSTRLDTSGASAGISTDANAVEVILEVSSVNALESTVSGSVQVIPGDSAVDEHAVLTRPIEVDLVIFSPVTDEQADPTRTLYQSTSVAFDSGRSALGLSAPIKLRPQGNFQNYPFDTYRSQILALVTIGKDAGLDATAPVNLSIVGDAPGWLIRDQPIEDEDGRDIATEATAAGAQANGRFATELFLTRAGSTKSFVILLLTAMVVLAVTALLVARAVRSKRRRIEATMASWFAAMLFAIIPLRLNMPGSPPIGVWIDFLVLLWVELAVMIGLAVFIGSWLRYTPEPDYAKRTDQAEPVNLDQSTTS